MTLTKIVVDHDPVGRHGSVVPHDLLLDVKVLPPEQQDARIAAEALFPKKFGRWPDDKDAA